MAIETNIWIYWLFCTIAMLVIILNEPFAQSLINTKAISTYENKKYKILLIAGWIATFFASISYILLTSKNEAGTYQISDLIAFSFLNGILEQFMFFFWFLLGCYLAKPWTTKNSKWIFISGYVSYAVFSGLIHALFWMNSLPEHQPATGIVVPLLSIMSYVWMWLFWKYKAILPIIAMHIFVDFFMIGHLHFSWFESV
jgi:chlorophyllide a hydrolase